MLMSLELDVEPRELTSGVFGASGFKDVGREEQVLSSSEMLQLGAAVLGAALHTDQLCHLGCAVGA